MAFILRKKLFFNNVRQYHKHLAFTDTPAFSVKNKEAIIKVFPEVVDTVCKGPTLSTQPTVAKWVKEILKHILTGGRLRRANDVTAAYVMFEKQENITEEKIHSSYILGWCAEMVCAHIFVTDDFMDSSTTRRNKLCWHRLPNVGINVINDTTLLHQAILEILENKFRHTPKYIDIVKLVNETLYFTAVGQQLDNLTVYSRQRNNLDCFNMKTYRNTVIYKTAYFTMRFPLLLGLMLIKDGQKQVKKEWIDIGFDIGELFQLHNDYSDLYVKEIESGKAGYDIQEGKLTWLALTAVPRCNDQQLAAFKEFYGSPDPDHAKQVKQIYDDLKIPELYEEYESKLYKEILNRINALPTEPERKFFLNLLGEWYKHAY
ncbi:unnamed protein product [Chrysodeixis includens]|uniref:Farnesyl pyrophosphate synthase n=1 Tax=Chrysodeixis includens TaxID=689277 RepID=A0A9P0BS45_CHRIL|nr:unnamed protein product [Chrysodeixis includens]